ncbi:MAG: FG-GAP-like repeat-containing protein, partial [Acidobacteriota bacterium]
TAALQNNPNVAYVEPNYIVHSSDTPNDPSYPQLWGFKNTGQAVNGYTGTPGADISAEMAWTVTKGSSSIVVGVVDTGVDYTHPDLAANIWSNPGGKGNIACAAGTHGFNAITRTCDPRDDNSHGTHVSGTIGALGNNSLGVVGVNWVTSIMALKFLDSGGYGNTADAIAAIDFAVQAKIDGVNVRVLSNSWGGGDFSKALLDEINKANEHDILFVASAGNDNSNNDLYPKYPASYTTPNMIAVAATDNRDALAWFSNYGATRVHLAAPGVDILSCRPGGNYQYLSGTSMAAPHVSGVAALVLAKTPGLTTAQVKSAILDNTDPIPGVNGKTVTGGRLNAAKAVGAQIAPDFAISISPASRTVVQGASTGFSITIVPSNGFTGSVDLSVSGLPSGASGSFAPPSTTSNSTLTVVTGASTPLGLAGVSVTGTSGALTHVITVALSIVTRPPITYCPSFSNPLGIYTSYAQTAVATGDFNRDGKTDLAGPILNSSQLYVVLGRGDGTFQYAASYGAGTAPLSVAVGDFNGDGKQDLAAANSITNNVSILLGAGDGTFQPAVNYPTGTNPFWLAAGDFDGDGQTDLVTANDGSNDVSILLGRGDGTFLAPASYSAGGGPFWVAAGDLDGDGRTDLAVANSHTNGVSVLLGNGDGTFQSAVAYGAGRSPSSVAIGDLNGDGKPDLAVANSGSSSVSILLGSGGGAFQTAVNYAAASGPSSVVIVDINGDGKADLAVSNATSNNVSILSGQGDGTFAAAINYPATGSPTQVVTGDFNGDGRPDLMMSTSTNTYLSLLLNSGVCSLNCNTIAAAVPYAAGTSPFSIAAGDFNGDGQPDLAVANSGTNNLSVLLGNSDGTVLTAASCNTGTAPRAVEVADVNGDGKRDLVVADSGANTVSVLIGNGNGSFQTASPYGSGNSPHAVIARDFNGDGKLDLAIANSGSNNVSMLTGAGDGTFQPAVNYVAGTSPESIVAGDFNRDGKLDLAVANSGSNNVSILLGNGNATFQSATSFNTGTTPLFVTAYDFNRDGKLDLAVANSGSNNVSILFGNGSGGFQSAVNYAVGTTPGSITLTDLNDDGRIDLAVTNAGSNNVSILLGNGDGTFVASGNIAAGTTPRSIISRDLNRDGKPDLAVANSGSDNVALLLNTCPAPDLTITKTHTGSFAQGSSGKIYALIVTNVGIAATDALVSVTETLPAGLTATGMSGSGWSCNVATVICTRGDALAGRGSYPPISLTVSVANSAPSTVTNRVAVSGGGEVNTVNSSASDPTTITPVTDLVVTQTHAGNFTQGDTGRIYRIVARNAGGSPTSGTVTVTESLPAGLTLTDISGAGWACSLATASCTRSDVLAASSSYPVILVTVNVSATAPNALTAMATVSGGGEGNASNDTAIDPTAIWSSQTCASFGAPAYYSTTPYSPIAIALGDFNGDGKTDLASANGYGNNVSIFLGNGDGTLAPAVNYA